MRENNKRKFLLLIVFTIIVLSSTSLSMTIMVNNAYAANTTDTSDIDKEVAAEEARMKELERKIEEHRQKAHHIGQQERSVLGELSKLHENTSILQQQNKVLTLKTQKLKDDINKLNKEIMETRTRKDMIVAQLRKRLIYMSRYGDAESISLFLSSESAHDAINSVYLLERLAVHDQKLIEELLDQENSLLENNRLLKKNREDLTSESEKLKNKQLEYDNVIATTKKFLGDVRKQKSLQEQAARDAEAAQREIGNTIADLRNRKKQRIAGEAQTPNAPGRIAYTYLATGSMLDWPLSGQISSPFGSRIHPVFKTRANHSGIDIAAPAGTAVNAAGPGEVLYAGWQRGFGQVIIIDHGRDISTVYAHLGAMYVNDGAAVKSGARIGAVGRTGTATGYHLHFEVRVGAEAKDPLRYLKRK